MGLAHGPVVTRCRTNRQLRLSRSGEPSRLSLRRRWISSSLKPLLKRALRSRPNSPGCALAKRRRIQARSPAINDNAHSIYRAENQEGPHCALAPASFYKKIIQAPLLSRKSITVKLASRPTVLKAQHFGNLYS